jgi:hypothetical protein
MLSVTATLFFLLLQYFTKFAITKVMHFFDVEFEQHSWLVCKFNYGEYRISSQRICFFFSRRSSIFHTDLAE